MHIKQISSYQELHFEHDGDDLRVPRVTKIIFLSLSLHLVILNQMLCDDPDREVTKMKRLILKIWHR